MPARRRIAIAEGAHAVRAWAATTPRPGQEDAPAAEAATEPASGSASGTPTEPAGASASGPVPRATVATAVRFTLEDLAERAPGRSVEVRVPPFGAVQVVAGTVHRRGTPPSVVETDAATWLALATGRLSWAQALEAGALHASGERCDLSPYLPLLTA